MPKHHQHPEEVRRDYQERTLQHWQSERKMVEGWTPVTRQDIKAKDFMLEHIDEMEKRYATV
jgi:hypothetical protein